ncbi:AraC family transcriptional regulator [Bythopirellula polymerisocia]|uniref:HTH araC/xylS-type domain-containing protein n=1 Tax=Bythopirellula polymerisocia TaxID=2528003 RepID=A0A5C6CNR2_9BACT|nr:AraC family transcriptional regulator [Bythopirellula polymerisocia]TWU26082.1 hypothetical protein Pla144_32990 [Bythopirellula polymerisocia]
MTKDAPDFDWFLEKLLATQTGIQAKDKLVREVAVVIWSNIHRSIDVNAIVREIPATRRTLERRFRDQLGLTICEVVAIA